MEASTEENISVDEAIIETYIRPIYGVDMRVSLDNKYIYDLDFKLVGIVVDRKNITWIDDE